MRKIFLKIQHSDALCLLCFPSLKFCSGLWNISLYIHMHTYLPPFYWGKICFFNYEDIILRTYILSAAFTVDSSRISILNSCFKKIKKLLLYSIQAESLSISVLYIYQALCLFVATGIKFLAIVNRSLGIAKVFKSKI